MALILVTYPIPGEGINLLKKAGHDVTVWPANQVSTTEHLEEAVQKYDAILALLTHQFNSDVLKHAGSQLKIIANYAVGFDNIDVISASEKNIIITNTPDVLSSAVAEHTIALIVATARRVVESDQFMRQGKYIGWKPDLLLGMELTGKTLGIIGVGRIGYDVARRAHLGLKMNIIYQDIRPNQELNKELQATQCDSVESLLMEADVVSLHVPLLPTTHHLINRARLMLFKPTAILINTARGPVIDEKALVQALRNKQLAGAGLDVFEEEPHLAEGLKELSNVIITPHIASATLETRSAMSVLAAKNILAVLNNQGPLTPVVITT